MRRIVIAGWVLFFVIVFLCAGQQAKEAIRHEDTEKITAYNVAPPEGNIDSDSFLSENTITRQTQAPDASASIPAVSEDTEVTVPDASDQPVYGSVELMACVVWSEAGNQDETGKRLVAATILNRVDDPRFPNTVFEVITQPSQFVYGTYYTQECYDAALAELQERTDYNVLWFWSTGYPPYGTPLYQHGGHFFSGNG